MNKTKVIGTILTIGGAAISVASNMLGAKQQKEDMIKAVAEEVAKQTKKD